MSPQQPLKTNNGANSNCKTRYGGTDISTLEEKTAPGETEVGCWRRIRAFFDDMKFEVLVFVACFSMAISRVSSASLMLDKSCLVYYGYSEEICRNLKNFTLIKSSVEKVSANYQLAYMLIRTIPSVFVSLSIGTWSDKYGRKLPLKVSMGAVILELSISAMCAHFIKSRPEIYLIAALAGGLGGSHATAASMFYSLVGDLTTVEKRTVKFARFEIAMGLSGATSIASGGWIYSVLGYTTVFLVAVCGFCFSLLWMLFFPETRGMDNKDTWIVKVKAFFSFQAFLESLRATTKKRPLNGRKIVWLLIASICIVHTVFSGTVDMNFLYAHHQFDWNNTQYSYVFAFYYGVGMILLLLAVPLLKRLKTSDSVIGQIGTGSLIAKYLSMGLAWNTSIFHLANALGLLSGCSAMAFRSRLSKVVHKDELGKVFSFLSTAETVLPIVAGVIFTQLFNAFLEIYPGTPYFFIVLIAIFPFSIATWLRFLPDTLYDDKEKGIESEKGNSGT